MSALSVKINDLLSAASGVAGIVGPRHYTLRAPQGTPVPYIIMSMPTRNIGGHLRGLETKLERVIVRFDMFGTNYSQLDTLRSAIISTMDGARSLGAVHTFGGELYEDDTRYFHFTEDFAVWNDV